MVPRAQQSSDSPLAIIAGTGSYLPPQIVTNERIWTLARQKAPEWIEQKLGIRERRLQLDPALLGGPPYERVPEIEMAAHAGGQALADARIAPKDVDGVWYISCTQPSPQERFSRQVMRLHALLGLRADAFALEMDAGCGGATHAMALASALISGGQHRSILIVASNAPSFHYDNWREYVNNGAWLSMYLFGDGAGAMLLTRHTANDGRGIMGTHVGVDPTHELMRYGAKGKSRGAMYEIDAAAVKALFPVYMQRALDGIQATYPFELSDVTRFYFHQVNGKLLRALARGLNVPKEKVAAHVDRYGNLAAAATLVLVDEDRRSKRVAAGDLCLFCTTGAGAQYGALLARL